MPNPPPSYCVHGAECFPNWHRIYMLDIEHTLRRADIFLGNDGNIGLPYWVSILVLVTFTSVFTPTFASTFTLTSTIFLPRDFSPPSGLDQDAASGPVLA